MWTFLGCSSIRARHATFRSHFLSSSPSMTQIRTVCDAVCHLIPWPFYCAHHHSATPRYVQRSPALRHTCRHETPDTVLHLFFPVCHLFFRWRHYCLPTTRRVTLHSPLSSHFDHPFSSTSTSFYKICLAPRLLVPYAFLSTPIHAYPRHSGAEITHTPHRHVL